MRRAKPLHRTHQYARDVLKGKIVAGPLVRLACARHERDMKQAKAKGFTFHEEAADHIIGFIETWVRLPDTSDEHGNAKPFLLEPWQAFVIGSMFGWKWQASGYRRFRQAFIEVGKGNGKTPMLAAIGLYGLMMDGQKAPEIYAAAADRDQAMIMFRDAVRMVDASPELEKRIRKTGIEHITNLAYGLGFFRPFSREQSSKSGTRPHMGLIDEVHEHPNAEIVNKIRAGAKGNMDALFPEITNSGYDRTSLCWQHHEHSRRIVEQALEDERWFSFVCALDDDDDPLEDESCHIKVNPNLGVSIQREYLRDQVASAKNLPIERNTVLRLNFCVWTQAQTRAIDMEKWRACPAFPLASELVGKPCYGGLDLGQSDDLSAWARIWDLLDGRIAVKVRFWIPEAAKAKFPNRPYGQWELAKLLEVTTSSATTDYDVIEKAVAEDCQRDGVRMVAYDKRFAEQMAQHLTAAGVVMVEQPQGDQLNEAIRRKLDLITNLQLCHGGNDILTWMADNYVTVEKNGRVRPAKDRSADKIDGQVALDMGLAVWVRMPVERPVAVLAEWI